MPTNPRPTFLPSRLPDLAVLRQSFARRSVLRGVAAVGAVGALGGVAACGGGGDAAAAGEATTLGSRFGDEVPRAAEDAVIAAFTEASGIEVTANVLDNETFQESINSYLQGNPDDVFTWFAGFRGRFFDDQGLVGDLTDVWADIEDGYTPALKEASSNGERQILVPVTNYPWAVFYRKSLFEDNGYTVPESRDDLIALCEQVQADGLIPFALGDADGWPAMGTFDILNMRLNGYDFHIALLAGDEDWDGPEVRAVFEEWAALLPYHQEDPVGRTWQDAAGSLLQKESAMYILGMFVGEQFPEGEERDDLDFFTFPALNDEFGNLSLDAPIDGYMMSADPADEAAAKEFLRFLGSAEAGQVLMATNNTDISVHSDVDTSAYTPLQQKAVELIESAENIAQFLDRDTRPDFASTIVIPALQKFLQDPEDIDSVLSDLQAGRERLFVEGS